MQAAADMPRPVGARCRDAAVCLALALLVASWLCAPAHGLGHVPRPGSLCPGCSGLSSQRPSTPALCCRRRGGPRRGGQRQGSPHPCSRRPGSRGLSCPGPCRTCAACSSTRALTTSVRGPPPWRACERAARLCPCSPPARLHCPALEQHGAGVRQCWAWARRSVYHTGPGQLDTAHVPVRQGLGRHAARVLRDVSLGLLRAGARRFAAAARALCAWVRAEGTAARSGAGRAACGSGASGRTAVPRQTGACRSAWQPGTVISGAARGPPARAGAAGGAPPAGAPCACPFGGAARSAPAGRGGRRGLAS